ncbi:MAG: metallophosphoesterase family protein [Armatimonadota bacterium]
MSGKNPASTRRELLCSAVGAAAAASVAAPAAGERATRRRTARLAHLTDIHVQPEGAAAEGMAACLRHVHAQQDRPELILNGGDMIMDALGASWERTREQWRVWKRVLDEHCTLPVVHCLGNHDVWGWHRDRSGATGTEPHYGKQAALEQLGLAERYRRLDHGGWRIIVLDSTHPVEGGVYTARLDDPQREWLAGELAATPRSTPVLILSHIPILCGCAFLDGENEKSGNWVVPGAWMHTDARVLKDLFVKHPQVKLCLSGHIHLRDRLDYNGVTYLCNGAVSGGWWKGSYQETPPGYALIDLFDDGSFEFDYVTYCG